MKYKYILAIAVLSLSVLMFNGCGKNNTEPATSEAIEESEPTEEIEEPDEEPEPEPEVPENTDTSNKEDNSEENSIAGTGVDSKTDEEIEAELEEIRNVEINEEGHRIVDGVDYDNDNNGQGWDIGGKHYAVWGDYLEEFTEAQKGSSMSQEEWDSFMQSLYGN